MFHGHGKSVQKQEPVNTGSPYEAEMKNLPLILKHTNNIVNLSLCADADRRIKTSPTDSYIVLERLIAAVKA